MRQDDEQYVHYDSPEDGPRPRLDKLTVPEAAERLGVTQDAIRKRVKRGYIEWEKDDDGRLYVWVDRNETPKDTSSDTSFDTSRDEVVSELRERLRLLERELLVWQEEARRKDHLLAAALERIPYAIEPPEEAVPEPRESPQKPPEESDRGETLQEQEKSSESRPPWWRRFFG